MNTYSLKPLPFFPTPYPGESLYSILCRYHVRCGNISPHRTIRQLFGDYPSLISTLLLPPMLDRFDFWTESQDFSAEYLLRHHTAFSLCKLRDFNSYQEVFADASHSSVFSRRIMRGWFQQSSIQHPSHELRYCPQCAFEQRKIYGESFWQILPQLDGVEYCPIHRVRIASSGIRTTKMQHAFFPADIVLDLSNPGYPSSKCMWYGQEHIEKYPDLFIAMALTVTNLWKNLPRVSGIWFLLSKYRSRLSLTDVYWQRTDSVRAQLLERNPLPMTKVLLNACSSVYDKRLITFLSLSLSQHSMLISMLFESPSSFFT